MVESRKQVEVAKEQSAKLAVANLEQEVGSLRMERDKYKGFWLEVKVKAERDQAKLNSKKQTVKPVNFDSVGGEFTTCAVRCSRCRAGMRTMQG